MSRIEVICPACGHVFSASENWRGATVQCPACADSVLVGAEQAESDELLDPWGDDESELTLAPAEDAVLTESPPAATECPQCSAPLPPGEPLCDHCGFSLRLNKPLEIESPDESTGFARWFNAQLEEGESVSSVLVFFELVMGIFAVILAVLFRPWSWFLLVPLIGAYLYLRFSGRAFGTLFWNRLLSVQRILGWREPAPPFRARRKYVAHSVDFDDRALASLAGLDEMEVLDLEGSRVSDESIPLLGGLPSLRFLVVRDSQVTHEGVLRLQAALPNAWIWQ